MRRVDRRVRLLGFEEGKVAIRKDRICLIRNVLKDRVKVQRTGSSEKGLYDIHFGV